MAAPQKAQQKPARWHAHVLYWTLVLVTLALLGLMAHTAYWSQAPQRLFARKWQQQWTWRRPRTRSSPRVEQSHKEPNGGDDESSSASQSIVLAHDVPLAVLEQRLCTGDLLLTRAAGFPSQRLHYVAVATYSPWSHVALIVREPRSGVLCVATSDELRRDEADGTLLLDVFGTHRPSGVGIYTLRTYLRTFDAQVLAVRALNMPLDDAAVWALLVDELYAYGYPRRSLLGYAGTLTARSVGSNFVTRRLEHAQLRDGTAMHCSGLVGHVYERMGVILPHTRGHWRYWLPRDFDAAPSQTLRFVAGHELGPLVFVDLESLGDTNPK